MKVAVGRAALLTALDRVCRIVPSSKSVPVLTYVRLDAEPGKLRISATDLVQTIEVAITSQVSVGEPGSVLAQAQWLQTVIRAFGVPGVAIATTSEGLLVKGESTHLAKTPAVDEYPTLPRVDESVIYTLPRQDFVASVSAVKPAVAVNSLNPKLEQIGLRKGKVQAADGIRFHEVELPDAGPADLAIPLPFLADLGSLLSEMKSDTFDIGVTEDRSALVVRHAGVTLTTATKQVDFPDVAQAMVVPFLGNDTTLRVSRTALASAVRRVRTSADPASRAISIQLGDDFSHATVAARQQGGSWAREGISVEWAGGARTLLFNHEYLLQLINLFADETLTLLLGEDAKHRPSCVLIKQSGRVGVLNQLRREWA